MVSSYKYLKFWNCNSDEILERILVIFGRFFSSSYTDKVVTRPKILFYIFDPDQFYIIFIPRLDNLGWVLVDRKINTFPPILQGCLSPQPKFCPHLKIYLSQPKVLHPTQPVISNKCSQWKNFYGYIHLHRSQKC